VPGSPADAPSEAASTESGAIAGEDGDGEHAEAITQARRIDEGFDMGLSSRDNREGQSSARQVLRFLINARRR
jgi:hypothetical protein